MGGREQLAQMMAQVKVLELKLANIYFGEDFIQGTTSSPALS